MSANSHIRSDPQKRPASRYQALSDSGSDTVATYYCKASGAITYYSGHAATLWGRKPAIGDTDQKFCGSHMLYRVGRGFMLHDQSPMADVLAGKVSAVFDAEAHIERPDGSRVMVIVNIAPLIDEGVIVGALSSFYDASQRKPANGTRATI